MINTRYVRARKLVNHTGWVTVLTLIDRPKSVCNRNVIELFGGFLYCHFAHSIFMLVEGLLS